MYPIIAYIILGLFFLIWTACAIADLPSELREGNIKVPSRYTVKKRIIRFFLGIERAIARLSGYRIKLPMYRRRLIREARVMQWLLERQQEKRALEANVL